MATGKKRVYEAAKEMGMSSEALVGILKSMSVDVKSHMSSIGDDVIERDGLCRGPFTRLDHG